MGAGPDVSLAPIVVRNRSAGWSTGRGQPRKGASLTRQQVPQVHRQVLQQLHIMFRHGRQRQVPPPSPADRPLAGELLAVVHGHRRQPYQPGDRGGHQDVLYRGVRELGQGRHEPLLQGEFGSEESGVQGARRGGWAQVSVRGGGNNAP